MKTVGPSKELRLTIKFLSHKVVYSVVYEKVSFSIISPTRQFKPHGILCRPSEGDCDVPEYCPGDNGDVSSRQLS